MKVLYDLSDRETRVQVLADDQCLKGFLRVERRGRGEVCPDLLLPKIRKVKLVPVADAEERITAFLANVNSSREPLEPVLIAEGTPPSGQDGRIEWLIHETKQNHDDESTVIDFHDRGPAVPTAKAGQPVARVVPPVPGAAGQDICGKELPATGHAAPLRPGKGVKLDADGLVVAECDGHLVYTEAGLLSIEPLYEIAKDVDFLTGNITFNGVVRIGGDVLDDFKVVGDKGITVVGMVGAAMLTADQGCVELRSGLAGQGRSVVRCQSFKARYVNSAEVRAADAFTVSGEVVNSLVEAGSKVVVSGRIIGGETRAGQVIEAGVVGSPMGAKTQLLRTKQARLTELEERQQRSETSLHQRSSRSEELYALRSVAATRSAQPAPGKGQSPPPPAGRAAADREEVEQMSKRLAELEQQEKLEQERQARLRKGSRAVYVHKDIRAGVVVRIGNIQRMFADQVFGPIQIVPDEEAGLLLLLPWSRRR